MEFDDISEFSKDTSFGMVKIRIMTLENALLIMISDTGRFKIGLSAIAIPPGKGSSEPTSTGLFSMNIDTALVRTMSERLAVWTNQTCMVIIGLKQMNREITLELLKLLRDYLVI
jgi:hypothetical protein